MLDIVRSPCHMSWFIQFNGRTIDVLPTRKEAKESLARMQSIHKAWSNA
jgi:hypothetical protein